MKSFTHKLIAQTSVFFLFFSIIVNPVFAQTNIPATSKQDDLTSTKDKYKSVTTLSDPGVKDEMGMDGQGSQPQFGMPGTMEAQQQISIHILGDVQSPGVYRVSVSDRAAEVFKYAKPNRPAVRLIQIRHPGDKTKYYDLYRYYFFGDLDQNPYLRDNDVIFVAKPAGAVRIEGPVKRSGIYELNGEKNLDQIIALAGGFTSAVSESKPIKMIRFSDGGEKKIFDVATAKDNLKKYKVQTGDIFVIPDIINSVNEFDYSVESIPGENLVYPTSVADVFVIGSVHTPGPYAYKSHLLIKDYVGFSGATSEANLKTVRVLSQGKERRVKMSEKVFAGDVVIVRNRVNFNTFIGYFTTITGVVLTTLLLESTLKDRL